MSDVRKRHHDILLKMFRDFLLSPRDLSELEVISSKDITSLDSVPEVFDNLKQYWNCLLGAATTAYKVESHNQILDIKNIPQYSFELSSVEETSNKSNEMYILEGKTVNLPDVPMSNGDMCIITNLQITNPENYLKLCALNEITIGLYDSPKASSNFANRISLKLLKDGIPTWLNKTIQAIGGFIEEETDEVTGELTFAVEDSFWVIPVTNTAYLARVLDYLSTAKEFESPCAQEILTRVPASIETQCLTEKEREHIRSEGLCAEHHHHVIEYMEDPTDEFLLHVARTHRLNDSQKEALFRSISCSSRLCDNPSLISVLQGPPGTGKTFTIACILMSMAACLQRSLCTAYTNVAVAEIAKKLLSILPTTSTFNFIKKPMTFPVGMVTEDSTSLRSIMLSIDEELRDANGTMRTEIEEKRTSFERKKSEFLIQRLSCVLQQHVLLLGAPGRVVEESVSDSWGEKKVYRIYLALRFLNEILSSKYMDINFSHQKTGTENCANTSKEFSNVFDIPFTSAMKLISVGGADSKPGLVIENTRNPSSKLEYIHLLNIILTALRNSSPPPLAASIVSLPNEPSCRNMIVFWNSMLFSSHSVLFEIAKICSSAESPMEQGVQIKHKLKEVDRLHAIVLKDFSALNSSYAFICFEIIQKIGNLCIMLLARFLDISFYLKDPKSGYGKDISLLTREERNTFCTRFILQHVDNLKQIVPFSKTLSMFVNQGSDQAISEVLQFLCNIMRKYCTFLISIKKADTLNMLLDHSLVVICTTTVTARKTIHDQYFRNLILDEACQILESHSCLLVRPTLHRVLLVGDHKQLPAFTKCERLRQYSYYRSMFERFILKGESSNTMLLAEQYRMHPDISFFPVREFYDSAVQDGVTEEDRLSCWNNEQAFPTLCFLDTSQLPMERIHESECEDLLRAHSRCNYAEAEIVIALLKRFSQHNPHLFDSDAYSELTKTCKAMSGENEECDDVIFSEITRKTKISRFEIGVITPYKGQADLIIASLEKYPEIRDRVEISTVDAFQGREKDLIIMSCVKANLEGTVGFTGDPNRLNVALTRARYALWIVGHSVTIESNMLLRRLVQRMRESKLLLKVMDFRFIMNHLHAYWNGTLDSKVLDPLLCTVASRRPDRNCWGLGDETASKWQFDIVLSDSLKRQLLNPLEYGLGPLDNSKIASAIRDLAQGLHNERLIANNQSATERLMHSRSVLYENMNSERELPIYDEVILSSLSSGFGSNTKILQLEHCAFIRHIPQGLRNGVNSQYKAQSTSEKDSKSGDLKNDSLFLVYSLTVDHQTKEHAVQLWSMYNNMDCALLGLLMVKNMCKSYYSSNWMLYIKKTVISISRNSILNSRLSAPPSIGNPSISHTSFNDVTSLLYNIVLSNDYKASTPDTLQHYVTSLLSWSHPGKRILSHGMQHLWMEEIDSDLLNALNNLYQQNGSISNPFSADFSQIPESQITDLHSTYCLLYALTHCSQLSSEGLGIKIERDLKGMDDATDKVSSIVKSEKRSMVLKGLIEKIIFLSTNKDCLNIPLEEGSLGEKMFELPADAIDTWFDALEKFTNNQYRMAESTQDSLSNPMININGMKLELPIWLDGMKYSIASDPNAVFLLTPSGVTHSDIIQKRLLLLEETWIRNNALGYKTPTVIRAAVTGSRTEQEAETLQQPTSYLSKHPVTTAGAELEPLEEEKEEQADNNSDDGWGGKEITLESTGLPDTPHICLYLFNDFVSQQTMQKEREKLSYIRKWNKTKLQKNPKEIISSSMPGDDMEWKDTQQDQLIIQQYMEKECKRRNTVFSIPNAWTTISLESDLLNEYSDDNDFIKTLKDEDLDNDYILPTPVIIMDSVKQFVISVNNSMRSQSFFYDNDIKKEVTFEFFYEHFWEKICKTASSIAMKFSDEVEAYSPIIKIFKKKNLGDIGLAEFLFREITTCIKGSVHSYENIIEHHHEAIVHYLTQRFNYGSRNPLVLSRDYYVGTRTFAVRPTTVTSELLQREAYIEEKMLFIGKSEKKTALSNIRISLPPFVRVKDFSHVKSNILSEHDCMLIYSLFEYYEYIKYETQMWDSSDLYLHTLAMLSIYKCHERLKETLEKKPKEIVEFKNKDGVNERNVKFADLFEYVSSGCTLSSFFKIPLIENVMIEGVHGISQTALQVIIGIVKDSPGSGSPLFTSSWDRSNDSNSLASSLALLSTAFDIQQPTVVPIQDAISYRVARFREKMNIMIRRLNNELSLPNIILSVFGSSTSTVDIAPWVDNEKNILLKRCHDSSICNVLQGDASRPFSKALAPYSVNIDESQKDETWMSARSECRDWVRARVHIHEDSLITNTDLSDIEMTKKLFEVGIFPSPTADAFQHVRNIPLTDMKNLLGSSSSLPSKTLILVIALQDAEYLGHLLGLSPYQNRQMNNKCIFKPLFARYHSNSVSPSIIIARIDPYVDSRHLNHISLQDLGFPNNTERIEQVILYNFFKQSSVGKFLSIDNLMIHLLGYLDPVKRKGVNAHFIYEMLAKGKIYQVAIMELIRVLRLVIGLSTFAYRRVHIFDSRPMPIGNLLHLSRPFMNDPLVQEALELINDAASYRYGDLFDVLFEYSNWTKCAQLITLRKSLLKLSNSDNGNIARFDPPELIPLPNNEGNDKNYNVERTQEVKPKKEKFGMTDVFTSGLQSNRYYRVGTNNAQWNDHLQVRPNEDKKDAPTIISKKEENMKWNTNNQLIGKLDCSQVMNVVLPIAADEKMRQKRLQQMRVDQGENIDLEATSDPKQEGANKPLATVPEENSNEIPPGLEKNAAPMPEKWAPIPQTDVNAVFFKSNNYVNELQLAFANLDNPQSSNEFVHSPAASCFKDALNEVDLGMTADFVEAEALCKQWENEILSSVEIASAVASPPQEGVVVAEAKENAWIEVAANKPKPVAKSNENSSKAFGITQNKKQNNVPSVMGRGSHLLVPSWAQSTSQAPSLANAIGISTSITPPASQAVHSPPVTASQGPKGWNVAPKQQQSNYAPSKTMQSKKQPPARGIELLTPAWMSKANDGVSSLHSPTPMKSASHNDNLSSSATKANPWGMPQQAKSVNAPVEQVKSKGTHTPATVGRGADLLRPAWYNNPPSLPVTNPSVVPVMNSIPPNVQQMDSYPDSKATAPIKEASNKSVFNINSMAQSQFEVEERKRKEREAEEQFQQLKVNMPVTRGRDLLVPAWKQEAATTNGSNAGPLNPPAESVDRKDISESALPKPSSDLPKDKGSSGHSWMQSSSENIPRMSAWSNDDGLNTPWLKEQGAKNATLPKTLPASSLMTSQKEGTIENNTADAARKPNTPAQAVAPKSSGTISMEALAASQQQVQERIKREKQAEENYEKSKVAVPQGRGRDLLKPAWMSDTKVNGDTLTPSPATQAFSVSNSSAAPQPVSSTPMHPTAHSISNAASVRHSINQGSSHNQSTMPSPALLPKQAAKSFAPVGRGSALLRPAWMTEQAPPSLNQSSSSSHVNSLPKAAALSENISTPNTVPISNVTPQPGVTNSSSSRQNLQNANGPFVKASGTGWNASQIGSFSGSMAPQAQLSTSNNSTSWFSGPSISNPISSLPSLQANNGTPVAQRPSGPVGRGISLLQPAWMNNTPTLPDPIRSSPTPTMASLPISTPTPTISPSSSEPVRAPSPLKTNVDSKEPPAVEKKPSNSFLSAPHGRGQNLLAPQWMTSPSSPTVTPALSSKSTPLVANEGVKQSPNDTTSSLDLRSKETTEETKRAPYDLTSIAQSQQEVKDRARKEKEAEKQFQQEKIDAPKGRGRSLLTPAWLS